eukprot:950433-Pleurochrysis_carterae.AAC.2
MGISRCRSLPNVRLAAGGDQQQWVPERLSLCDEDVDTHEHHADGVGKHGATVHGGNAFGNLFVRPAVLENLVSDVLSDTLWDWSAGRVDLSESSDDAWDWSWQRPADVLATQHPSETLSTLVWTWATSPSVPRSAAEIKEDDMWYVSHSPSQPHVPCIICARNSLHPHLLKAPPGLKHVDLYPRLLLSPLACRDWSAMDDTLQASSNDTLQTSCSARLQPISNYISRCAFTYKSVHAGRAVSEDIYAFMAPRPVLC